MAEPESDGLSPGRPSAGRPRPPLRGWRRVAAAIAIAAVLAMSLFVMLGPQLPPGAEQRLEAALLGLAVVMVLVVRAGR